MDSLARWAAAGAPLDADPARPPPATFIADVSVDLGADVVPDRALADDVRCFVIDLGVAENRLATAFRVRPDARALVHHVGIDLYDASARAAIASIDAETAEPGWPCEMKTVPIDVAWPIESLGTWLPGMDAVVAPAGTGFPIPRGAIAVVQVHYHTGGVSAVDRTRIDLALAPPGAPLQTLHTFRVFDWDIDIPPGAGGVIVEGRGPLRAFAGSWFPDGEGWLVGIGAHMHRLGAAFTIATDGAAGPTTLLDIPRWDFDWQEIYSLAAPLRIAEGDPIDLRCVYDNTTAHRLAAGADPTPRHVYAGTGSDDEMCGAYLLMVDDRPR